MTDGSHGLDAGRPHSDPGTTSLSLLERCRQRDAEAWERLARLYYPVVYGWCRKLRLRAEDAKDVSQNVFQALQGSFLKFEHRGRRHSFRGWLWGIARNQANNFHRRNRHQPLALGGSDGGRLAAAVLSPEDPPSDADDDRQLVLDRALELMRGSVEPRTWEAFYRATIDGESVREIAADLGMTPNAVYLAKSRVLRLLREELDGFLDL